MKFTEFIDKFLKDRVLNPLYREEITKLKR